MKVALLYCFLFVCCLGLWGCPYESQVPISAPAIPVDTRLLGRWTSQDEVYNTYTVSRASETEYQILQQNVAGTARFRGHFSEVRNALFMNLYSDSTNSYYLYRVQMTPAGDKITLLPLDNNLPHHFGSSEGLKTYLEKNYAFQSLYNEKDKAEFSKVGSAPAGF